MGTFLWLLWLLFRWLLNLLLQLKWKINGVSKQPTDKPARVMRILIRKRFFEVIPANAGQFICDHITWESASVVLQPGVTLFSIDEKWATFVEGPSPLELSTAHPFYYSAQFQLAKRVIRLPISELHTIAKNLPRPKPGQLVYLYSTGRCGSTLLCKALSQLPRTLSLSEPDSYTNVYINNKLSDEEKERILASVLRLELHAALHGKVDRVVVKLRSQCTPQAAVMNRLEPAAHLFFMYRDCQDVAFSMVRTFGDFPVLNQILKPDISHWWKKFLLSKVLKNVFGAIPGSDFRLDVDAFGGFGVIRPIVLTATVWLQQLEVFVSLRKSKVALTGLRYEDLLARPMDVFQELLALMEVPQTVVDESFGAILKSMKTDSQKGSAISRKKGGLRLTEEDKKDVKSLLAKHPFIRCTDYIADGTILHT